MRVVVDALAARTGGGLTYLRSLLPAAVAADDDLRLFVAVTNADLLPELAANPHISIVELPTADALPQRLAWEQTGLVSLCSDVGADLLFAPSEIAPLRCTTPLVVGLQNPNLFAPWGDVRQRLRLRVLRAAARASVRRADAVVFVSDAFRGVAEPHLPASSARRHTVTVGIDARFSPDGGADRFEAFRPYVLAVSDVYRYKSLPLAVDAFAALAHERPSLRLVLAGRAQDAVESARIDEHIEQHALRDRVHRLGPVDHDEMPALYRGASCFVFPSTLESLGLPPLEALACGVPVVAAHASVMPDVLDGAAAFFAPGDAAAAVAALRGALDGGGQDAQARRDVLARHDPAVVGAALAAVFRETARQ